MIEIVLLQKIFSSNENYENEDLVAHPDSEETEKAEEIRDEVIYRLKYHANLNNSYNCFYFVDEGADLSFTEYEGANVARLYFIIPNPDKYNEILNELNKTKDIYRLGYNEYNKNCFYLSTIAKPSEDVTIISNTLIDLNYNSFFNKKNNKITSIKSVDLSKDHIDWGNIARDIVLNNKFTHVFGFIIKRENDHVDITHVKYKHYDKFNPNLLSKVTCRNCKRKLVLKVMNGMLDMLSD
ncbi:fam-a protein [Plasmodium vinckei brucechwatti]|uniref:Fam-a protein n=1 Tax=Plasmodium vinckei brucechwatti TaxID=119398 RepID=A0A6V7RUU1_PLAVN|nr:fam-a protein [Plasmodium vinckei brucechwatti]